MKSLSSNSPHLTPLPAVRSILFRSNLPVFFLILVFLAGCKKGSDSTTPEDKYLVSSSLVGDFTKDQLTPRLAAAGLGAQYAGLIQLQYGVKAYKLVYKTKNTDGTDIQASGLLLVPTTPNAVAMISQQHGTIFNNAQAPSNYDPASEAYSFSSVFSALGYIIACPDYIGFGESNNLPHTYEHRAGLAQASLDMLRAAREFIQRDKSINWDSRLYLTGYSEGGFATMSLYKKMQDEVPTEFNLKAVTCGAGAYDKTNFMKALLSQKTHGVSDYNDTYLWVLLTYDRIYGLNRPLSSYFKEPYLTEITAKRERATINVSFDEIFTDAFKQGVLNGTDTAFLNAVADNNVYDWKPATTLWLYHGDADQQVFYLNSLNAYNAMQKQGAGETVRLFTLPGKGHPTSIPDYILGSYTLFSTVK